MSFSVAQNRRHGTIERQAVFLLISPNFGQNLSVFRIVGDFPSVCLSIFLSVSCGKFSEVFFSHNGSKLGSQVFWLVRDELQPPTWPSCVAWRDRAMACSDDLQADGAATLASGAALVAGPTCLRDVFLWPEHMLEMLEKKGLLQNLHAKAETGLNIYTDWSGLGMPESTFLMINDTLAQRGEPSIPVVNIRATDFNPLCQRVLSAYSSSRPKHLFNDIHERVPANVLQQMMSMTQQAQARLKQAHIPGKKLNVEMRDHLGEQLVFDMCNILKGVDFTALRCHCSLHESLCPIWGHEQDLLNGALDGAIIGNDCTDWSSVGAQMEFLWLWPHHVAHLVL